MRLENKVVIPLVITIFLYGTAFAGENSSEFTGEINASNVNIRANSTINSEIICKVNKGEHIEVVSQFYDWYKIKLPSTTPAYIHKNMVVLKEAKPLDSSGSAPARRQDARVLKYKVNIRLHPSKSSPIIGWVDKDEIVTVIGEEGEWYRIVPVAHSFGWIHKKFVQRQDESSKPTVNIKEGEKPIVSKDEPQEKITLEGIINPCGKIFHRAATHKLVTKDNRVFLLTGMRGNLNLLNYCKVKITGKIITLPKQKYPALEVEKLEVLD